MHRITTVAHIWEIETEAFRFVVSDTVSRLGAECPVDTGHGVIRSHAPPGWFKSSEKGAFCEITEIMYGSQMPRKVAGKCSQKHPKSR